MSNTFGAVLKKLRLEAGFGLRRFAELVAMAPSNLSAIENDRRAAPEDPTKLREIADALGLAEGSAKLKLFFDAARKSGELPTDVRAMADRPLVPALLRTVENCQLTDEQIAGLIRDIEERHGGKTS
jgi:transcriptional regulator with XRE-family HTH domain